MPDFASLKDEYTALWRGMKFEPSKAAAIEREARDIYREIEPYRQVEALTRVPASIVAVIHNRESDRDFSTHLHNGDPLTARTTHVPAGRPLGSPPFTWAASAVDALRMEGMDLVRPWTIERAAFELEKYNGFGYRTYHPETDSPYLWAATSVQDPGKYVADGKWNRTAFDTQLGCMPVLAALWAIDPALRLPPSDGAFAPAPAIRDWKWIQAKLATAGLYTAVIDGDPGPKTEAAVAAALAKF